MAERKRGGGEGEQTIQWIKVKHKSTQISYVYKKQLIVHFQLLF